MLGKKTNLVSSIMTLILICSAPGCATMRSTLYSHDGCQTCEKTKKHLKGVPTTLEIPTDIRISVFKTTYGTANAETGAVTMIPNFSTTEIDYDIVKQKEIYAVDFKRPGAGKLDYQLTFDKDKQYITKIVNTSTDETIAKVSDLLATVITTLPKVAGGPSTGFLPGGAAPKNLIPFQKVVAVEVFSLNEPNLEARIQAFLDQYVNSCAPCQGGVCPYPPPPPACYSGHDCRNMTRH